MKYLLIEVIGRDINEPDLFESYEEAFKEMCSRVAEVLHTDISSIMESYLNGEEFDDNTCVTEYSAWAEGVGHNNCDWKICRFEIN